LTYPDTMLTMCRLAILMMMIFAFLLSQNIMHLFYMHIPCPFALKIKLQTPLQGK